MTVPTLSLLALVAILISTPLTSATYTLTHTLNSSNFFQNFNLYSGPDPTKGFVQYQNLSSAISKNLIGIIDSNIFLGVDYTTSDPSGRASVRAESTITFNKGLLIADIAHMPANVCGSWPAFWLLGAEGMWPETGEVDILEGVNDEDRNAITLHTAPGCVVDNATTLGAGAGMGGGGGEEVQMEFLGEMITDDCYVKAPDQGKNVGCSIKAPAKLPPGDGASGDQSNPELEKLPSYGADFNAVGGGVYALEWTDSFIQAWFFPHSSSSTIDFDNPHPESWGTPIAKFQGDGCDFAERFKDQKIIFNTAFCGDWAGAEDVWGKSCKKKTGVEKCEDYVRDNPRVFEEVYWEIRGLKWFENDEEIVEVVEEVVEEKIVSPPGRYSRW